MNKKILWKISYGMYIISSFYKNKLNGQVANTVFQVSSEPEIISVSINKKNLTHECIKESKVFSVSILKKDTPMKFIGTFGFKSGRDIDKFKNVDFFIGKTKAPIVRDYSIGYIEIKVIKEVDCFSHTIFIGKVIDGKIFNEKSSVLTYDYYHKVKNGFSPKNAPTYIEVKREDIKEEKIMKKYRCTVCGYIYDPEKGDPDSGIVPGTPFEKIPDDWVCPVCGVSKDDFEPIEN